MRDGGAERVSALLCNRWVEQGHEVTLVPTYSGRGECSYPLDERVRLTFLADRVGSTGKSPLTLFRRFLAMRSLVRQAKPHAVLSFLSHVNIAVLIATRGTAVPVVIGERTFPPAMPLGGFWERLRRLTYPWANRVVMQTRDGAEWLNDEIPDASGAIIANPCAYPLPSDEPRILPDAVLPASRKLLLGVGRLDELKQFDKLISAFAKIAMQSPDWDLAILGEGRERATLEAQIAKLGLTGRVILPGRAGNVADWYDRADLYAMTSRFEGFPNTLLEALSYGVPAVSFDCATGPADMIEDGVNGYLVAPTAGVEGLQDRLALLMADDNKRAQFSANAVAIRERFSFEGVGAAWDRVLEIGQGGGN